MSLPQKSPHKNVWDAPVWPQQIPSHSQRLNCKIFWKPVMVGILRLLLWWASNFFDIVSYFAVVQLVDIPLSSPGLPVVSTWRGVPCPSSGRSRYCGLAPARPLLYSVVRQQPGGAVRPVCLIQSSPPVGHTHPSCLNIGHSVPVQPFHWTLGLFDSAVVTCRKWWMINFDTRYQWGWGGSCCIFSCPPHSQVSSCRQQVSSAALLNYVTTTVWSFSHLSPSRCRQNV